MKDKHVRLTAPPELFDSHCHLDFADFDPDRAALLQRCQALGIRGLCIPSTRYQDWSRVMALASRQAIGPQRCFALGLHPLFMAQHQPGHVTALAHYLQAAPKGLVAVGEIGLDFATAELQATRERQLALFQQQLELAGQYRLAVIIHARKAHDQVLSLLRRCQLTRAGIIHGFSGSAQQAGQYLDLGFKLGFGGVLTYERARKTRQLAACLPLDSLVLETDAPGMPLCGQQGQRNSPTCLPQVLAALARLRKESPQEIAQTTTANARAVFGLRPPAD